MLKCNSFSKRPFVFVEDRCLCKKKIFFKETSIKSKDNDLRIKFCMKSSFYAYHIMKSSFYRDAL
ncbi:hypothetical protein LEP1GSC068_1417 [Leptospira sp. Fiocruz LV3954]|nr:hypothetical protein LEP1GSC068_1417 [Leptospira sp. Fiocruz LV3954]EMI63825.1 hypothetical protein LEP1GSC076_3027 [Leptospira sp. Fiocruz LV4135]